MEGTEHLIWWASTYCVPKYVLDEVSLRNGPNVMEKIVTLGQPRGTDIK